MRNVERGIRLGILGAFVHGIRRRNPAIIVNAVLSYGASFLPGVVERMVGIQFRPWQRIYVEIAMLTHAVGMCGPYDEVWWWDHLTHTHSATLLGGLVHVIARRRNQAPTPRVLAAVMVVSLGWEVLEFLIHVVARRLGFEPILVVYGPRDTLLDLVFDLVGALLVLLFGDWFLANFVKN
ncbi:hypothetical protein [Halospeciosus flavus]|uniref:Uncharacterized protein n=1 Tax=Halospeciosus flavus TaxID=3032283 RepID=A0ABD5Z3J6_9EURY